MILKKVKLFYGVFREQECGYVDAALVALFTSEEKAAERIELLTPYNRYEHYFIRIVEVEE